MKSNFFEGFGIVFKHNLKIHMKSKKYIVSTIIIALLVICAMTGLMMFIAKENQSSDYEYNVKKVYVIDETGKGVPDYATLATQLGYDDVAKTEFVESKDKAENVLEDKSVEYVILHTLKDDKYDIKLITGKKVDTDKPQIDCNVSKLCDFIENTYQAHLFSVSGLTGEQIVQVSLPVKSSVIEMNGEEVNEMKMLVILVCVFIFLMLIYFLVLFYGVQISADVPVEKTSKLIDQLILTVSPYALVSGKILSIILSCIIQFLIWIVSIFAGVFIGDRVALSLFENKNSLVNVAFDFVSAAFEESGFTPMSIIVAILLACFGLVFYLLLAGLGGAMLSKPESASNVQMIFILPLIISCFFILIGSGMIEGNFDSFTIYSLVPFTGAMCAPASALVGLISIPMALLAILINVVCCVFILAVASKIYEGLLFFNGAKVTFKDIVRVLKK